MEDLTLQGLKQKNRLIKEYDFKKIEEMIYLKK